MSSQHSNSDSNLPNSNLASPELELSGQLVLGDTIKAGRLRFNHTINEIVLNTDTTNTSTTNTSTTNTSKEFYILAGFIDSHVHGGGGADTMDGVEGIIKLAQFHASKGTTTLLPTTITNPWEKVLDALNAIKQAIQEGVPNGADIVGAHLEGPFISPHRLGAQPNCTLLPTPQRVAEALASGIVRAVTIAPEVEGAFEAAATMALAGVRIGVGHTRADTDTMLAFLAAMRQIKARVCSTHLFNAMGGIEGRDPSVAGTLLVDTDAYQEVILDEIHVHPTSFLLACAAAKGRVTLITDAMRAAGLGDGISELGGQKVLVKDGKATLESGSLAGSVLTLDIALKNAVAAGLSLPEVSAMLSRIPAQSLALTDRGELKEGLRADIVILDKNLNLHSVYVAGKQIKEVNA